MSDYSVDVRTEQTYTVEVEHFPYAVTIQDPSSQTVEVIESGLQGAPGAAGQGVPIGGTTGQILSKNSGTDYDTGWSNAETAGAIVDTASWVSPTLITTTITVPANQRARMFLAGNGGAVVGPTLSDGSGTKELFLVGTSNSATIELNSTTNLLLSGKIILRQGTILSLQWVAGLVKFVEVGRNEI